MPTVTGVRWGPSDYGTHRHIAGVCTADGSYFTTRDVISQLRAGQTWRTFGDGRYGTIRMIDRCPVGSCRVSPYITTAPDDPSEDDLDDLPTC
jgi:hypothetical protein